MSSPAGGEARGLGTSPGRPPSRSPVYCCGPEPLLAAVEEECARWPVGALHVERFAPKEGADDGPRAAFEVELATSGTLLTVPADRTVLEVVEESGVPVLSSGQEGTCETTVLDGVPDHRDSLPTAEERAANDTMRTCVSRSCSGRLVLDL